MVTETKPHVASVKGKRWLSGSYVQVAGPIFTSNQPVTCPFGKRFISPLSTATWQIGWHGTWGQTAGSWGTRRWWKDAGDGVPRGLEKINTRNSEATFSVLRVGSDPTLGENAEIFLKAAMRLWHKQVTCPPGRAEERTVENMGKEGPAEPGKGKEKNSYQ